MKAALGDKHVQTYLMELQLAEVLTALEKLDEAQALARGVLERATASEGPESKPAFEARIELGRALSAAGRHEEALKELDEVLAKGGPVMTESSSGSRA